jgi:nucleotide-binding universal stress UspA family protein
MTHWIVSSKHSRDDATRDWDSKWTADNFLRRGRFVPSKRQGAFAVGDRCILKVFGTQEFIGDFRIASGPQQDRDNHVYYDLDEVNEWDFPVHQSLLPSQYTSLLSRSPSTDISERVFYELLGIRNFTQNLRINYRNRLEISVSEGDIENLLDAKNGLRSVGLEIIERQREFTPGNRIDLLCKEQKGDLVVVELKKHGPNETIGQLARYVTDVREKMAKPGQKVRGLILAFDVDEQLIKAARGVDFDVMLYQIRFV